MKKLIHLIMMVIVFGSSLVAADTNNRQNIKLFIGKKEYINEYGEKAYLTTEPIVKKVINDQKSKDVALVPIRDLKSFFDMDSPGWDADRKMMTLYIEKPLIIFNSQDKDETTTVINQLAKRINSADESIIIEMYRLQEKSIIKTLHDIKHAKGGKINIKIILDKHPDNKKTLKELNIPFEKNSKYKDSTTIIEYLKDVNCEIKWKSCGSIMHRKIAVFDDETYYLGSGNWTEPGLTGKNWEMNIIWKNKEYAGYIKQDFDEMWDPSSGCTEKDY